MADKRMADPLAIPQRRIRWQPAWRIVPSRYPAVGPWDRIATPADFEALAAIEGLTNPRLREELGVLSFTPRERWLTGPGSTPVMAAFAHRNPEGSRFSDGSYGVFYASRALETAIRETVFHRERFLARTHEPAMQLQMRSYQCRIACTLHDLRGGYPALHQPTDYAASQRQARVCAPPTPTASCTTAFAIRAANALPCSGLTRSARAGWQSTMLTTGTAPRSATCWN